MPFANCIVRRQVNLYASKVTNSTERSATIGDGRIYTRVAVIDKDKKRQEWLYCLGTK
jgi:hypothetical protein